MCIRDSFRQDDRAQTRRHALLAEPAQRAALARRVLRVVPRAPLAPRALPLRKTSAQAHLAPRHALAIVADGR
eukprot:6449319-Lingulodinium_polyedra.AAC.1